MSLQASCKRVIKQCILLCIILQCMQDDVCLFATAKDRAVCAPESSRDLTYLRASVSQISADTIIHILGDIL